MAECRNLEVWVRWGFPTLRQDGTSASYHRRSWAILEIFPGHEVVGLLGIEIPRDGGLVAGRRACVVSSRGRKSMG